jgi:tungstate transport system ATP-binding protein
VKAPVIRLSGIAVERGRRTVLDVPTLDICRDEVLAVVGPNGAGKSTLLRVLALLERPARGEVMFGGTPVAGSPLPYRRRMALVFQEPLLLDTTVEANVRTGLSMRGVAREEQKRRSEEWLERFGIAHLRGRSPRGLSGGEAQRASLARAFALQPEVLLLDEPFGSLDPPTRESLIEDLDAVLTANRVATVFVTHDRAEALRLGDRIAVLMQGRIRQLGAPGEVFSSPMNEEVAAFVGVETIIPGRVRSANADLATVDAGDAEIETATDLKPGSDVLVCLRPEDVVLSEGIDSGTPMSARNHLRASVSRIRQTGPYIRVELDAGFPLVALITKQSLEDLALSPGSSVVATFKATAVHLIPHRRA